MQALGIGAGVVGLSAALRLQEAGCRRVLVNRFRRGGRASCSERGARACFHPRLDHSC